MWALGFSLSIPSDDLCVQDDFLHILTQPAESIDLDVLTSSPLPSALSLLLQRCNEGQLDLTESVMEIIETLVNNGKEKREPGWVGVKSLAVFPPSQRGGRSLWWMLGVPTTSQLSLTRRCSREPWTLLCCCLLKVCMYTV